MRGELHRQLRRAVRVSGEDLANLPRQRVARVRPPATFDLESQTGGLVGAVAMADKQVALGAVATKVIQQVAVAPPGGIDAIDQPRRLEALDEFAFIPRAAGCAGRKALRALRRLRVDE